MRDVEPIVRYVDNVLHWDRFHTIDLGFQVGDASTQHFDLATLALEFELMLHLASSRELL
jgi:hypothetical protein